MPNPKARRIHSPNNKIKRQICKEIGQMLRHARIAKGYTTRELARIIGMSHSYISHIEQGIIFPDLMHVLLYEAGTGVPGLLEGVVAMIRRNFKVEILEDVKIGMQKMLEYLKETDENSS